MINKERKENPYYSATEENIVRGENLKVHLRNMEIKDILNRLKLGEELTLNGEVLELPTDHMWGEYPHEDYIEYLTVLKECYYSKLLIDSISSLYGLDDLKILKDVKTPLELREFFDVKKYFDDVIYQKYQQQLLD